MEHLIYMIFFILAIVIIPLGCYEIYEKVQKKRRQEAKMLDDTVKIVEKRLSTVKPVRDWNHRRASDKPSGSQPLYTNDYRRRTSEETTSEDTNLSNHLTTMMMYQSINNSFDSSPSTSSSCDTSSSSSSYSSCDSSSSCDSGSSSSSCD